MATSKYPLRPLLEHRERKVDDATAELGDAVRAREAAEDAHRKAEAQRMQAEAQAARVKLEEAERLARGELRAADLARGEAWEIGARAQIGQLTRVEATAEQKTVEARDEEVQARAELAKKMADRDVVAKDESRFEQALKKRAESAEEEAAEEALQGKTAKHGKTTGGRRS
jgi:hypothetical protein